MNEMAHIRISKNLKEQIQEFVDAGLFSSMTEFIKESIRKNIEDYNKRLIIARLRKRIGCLKGKVKPLTKEERLKLAEGWLKEDPLKILREFKLY